MNNYKPRHTNSYGLRGLCQAYLASAEMQCNDERLNDIYNDIAHKCKKVREMLED